MGSDIATSTWAIRADRPPSVSARIGQGLRAVAVVPPTQRSSPLGGNPHCPQACTSSAPLSTGTDRAGEASEGLACETRRLLLVVSEIPGPPSPGERDG